jgi:hypothetical protein
VYPTDCAYLLLEMTEARKMAKEFIAIANRRNKKNNTEKSVFVKREKEATLAETIKIITMTMEEAKPTIHHETQNKYLN